METGIQEQAESNENVLPTNNTNIVGTLSSQNTPTEEYSYIQSVDNEIRRSGEGAYDYIALEDIPGTSNQQAQRPSQNTDEQGVSSETSIQTLDHDIVPTVIPQQCGSNSSGSSSGLSDTYLKPVSHEVLTDSDGNESGYDYSDVVSAQQHQPSQYSDLLPRAPPIPTVYDRLRHSRLGTES